MRGASRTATWLTASGAGAARAVVRPVPEFSQEVAV